MLGHSWCNIGKTGNPKKGEKHGFSAQSPPFWQMKNSFNAEISPSTQCFMELTGQLLSCAHIGEI